MTRDDRTRRADERRPGPSPERESPRDRDRAPRSYTRASRRGKARLHPLPIIVAVLVVAVAVAGVWFMAPRKQTAAPVAKVWTAVATETAEAAVEVSAGPTPAFASFRDTKLLLPVPVADVTAIVFHQSSFKDTFQMTPLVAIRTASDAKAAVDAERAGGEPAWPRANMDVDEEGVWTGSALELWRTNVAGKSDSALDCGAKPGTPVFSPVSGTVMRIRAYKLYGTIDDFEIHIKTDAWNDVDIIILHVTGPTVALGQHVDAGLTQVASVRALTSKLSGLQLRSYTVEGGNHTHVQLTIVPKPGQTWVVGQDPPGFKRKGD